MPVIVGDAASRLEVPERHPTGATIRLSGAKSAKAPFEVKVHVVALPSPRQFNSFGEIS